MNSREGEQNNKKTDDPKNDAGVTVQIHTAFACKQISSDEEGDSERRVYKHHNGSKDKAYCKGCRGHLGFRNFHELKTKHQVNI